MTEGELKEFGRNLMVDPLVLRLKPIPDQVKIEIGEIVLDLFDAVRRSRILETRRSEAPHSAPLPKDNDLADE